MGLAPWSCNTIIADNTGYSGACCGAELVLDLQHRDSQTQVRHFAMEDISDWWESTQCRHAFTSYTT